MAADPAAAAVVQAPPDLENMTEDERARYELQDIQMKMNQTTDDSLESTRRMLAMCEEGKDAGIRTLVMLDEQGEQLDKVEEGLDEINRDMKEAEEALEGMEKCCGLCVLPWKKTKNFEGGAEYNAVWKKDNDGQINADGPRVAVGGGPQMGGEFITRITNDDREKEMENNIGEVSGMITNFRNMAIDMGSEIGSQNRAVDRINAKATSNEARIKVANQRAQKLL